MKMEFDGDSIFISGQLPLSLNTLFCLYKYTDNSPCGRLAEKEDNEREYNPCHNGKRA